MKKQLLTGLLALTLPQLSLAQTAPTPAPATATPATTTPAVAPAAPAPAPTAPTSSASIPAAPSPTAPATPAPNTVVATVGGQDYTYAQFSQIFKLAIARNINAQGVPYSDEIAAQFAPMRGSFLPVYARQQALVQLATKAGFKPDTAAVDAQIKTISAQFKTEGELAKALGQSGFESVDAYRHFSSEQQQVSDYLKSVQGKFKFSDSLVQSFYTMHKAAFTQKASACVKHILVGSDAEAQQVVKDLNAGGDFAAIAKAKSNDPGSAAKGGDLGCLAQGDTVPEFDKASFSGPLNKVQTVKSQFGYHVLIVTKRNAAGVQPFADVQGKIRQQLSNEAAHKYIDSLIKRVPTTLHAERLGLPAQAPASAAQPATPAPAKK